MMYSSQLSAQNRQIKFLKHPIMPSYTHDISTLTEQMDLEMSSDNNSNTPTLIKQMQSLQMSPDNDSNTSTLCEQLQSFKMSSDNDNNTSKLTSKPTRRRIVKEQHHWDRTYQCLVVWSEYDCGHELPQTVRDPRCWKCEELQPCFCIPTDWDIGADGLCPTCDMVKKGEERARQRRLAMGLPA